MSLPDLATLRRNETPTTTTALVTWVLQAVRDHLDMEVAFASRFDGERLEYRHVDGDGTVLRVRPGEVVELGAQVCDRIRRTRGPVTICDTGNDDSSAVRDTAPRLRTYVGVPIFRADGTLFGSLCGLSTQVRPNLSPRDESFLRALADVVSHALEREDRRLTARRRRRIDVQRLLTEDAVSIVYQPICSLRTNDMVGVEALSRFPDGTAPDVWFKRAQRVGLHPQLELHALRRAVESLHGLPDHLYLSVNVSPQVAASAELERALAGLPANRLVIELTEHRQIHSYRTLASVVDKLRQWGCRVAVDDAGAGYASFRLVMELAPDIVKIDRSLVAGLHRHSARRALMTGLVSAAEDIGVTLVAEGVEDAADHRALLDTGMAYGQGFHFRRPAPLEALFPGVLP